MLDEPIRKLDKYEVPVQFDEGVRATIGVWLVPPRDAGEPLEEGAIEWRNERLSTTPI